MKQEEMIADMKMTIGMMMVTQLWKMQDIEEKMRDLWDPESEEECIRKMIADTG